MLKKHFWTSAYQKQDGVINKISEYAGVLAKKIATEKKFVQYDFCRIAYLNKIALKSILKKCPEVKTEINSYQQLISLLKKILKFKIPYIYNNSVWICSVTSAQIICKYDLLKTINILLAIQIAWYQRLK